MSQSKKLISMDFVRYLSKESLRGVLLIIFMAAVAYSAYFIVNF